MKLVIEQGDGRGAEYVLDRPLTVIGRGKQSDIILQESMASRQHAQITRDHRGWWLTDLGSTNGTQIDGRAIPAHQAQFLQPGNRVTIGNSVLVLGGAPSRATADGPGGIQRHRRAILIGGAALLVLVLGAVVALLILALRPASEGTQPGAAETPQVGQTGLPVPTALDAIMTSIPVPTDVESLTTALPIPTDLEEMVTAMPGATDLLDFVTSMPAPPAGFPGLPLGGTATP